MKRALLYRRGGLGDTLLTFPLLEILKRRGFHTTAVGNTDYFAIAKQAGWADRTLSERPKEEQVLKVNPFQECYPLTPWRTHPSKIGLFCTLPAALPRRTPIFGLEPVYLVGEADQWMKGKVKGYVESYDPVWIARAIREAELFIGLDSGLSHLSAYSGVPTVVIYGPSDPVIWKPIGEKVYQLSLELECSPCFPHVCDTRECLNVSLLLERLIPLLDDLLVKVNENNLL